MNKTEKIKRAYISGIQDYKTLAANFFTTEKYVAKVIREANLRPNDKRTLTLSAYIEAVFLGYSSVADLSVYFNVSERTIKRFNASNQIRENLSKYFHVLNHSLKWSDLEHEPEQPTLQYVCEMLKDICSSIEPISKDNKQAGRNIKKIKKIIAEIKQITPY